MPLVAAVLGIFLTVPAYAQEGVDLEPIVVQQEEAAPFVSAVITADEIRRRALGSPEAVLAALGADVQARGHSGIKSDLAVNGSTFQQVLILVNGVRVKDSQTAHHDLDLFFNIDDIERVELIPASAAVKYGPDGVAGAVNFVLKEPAPGAAGKNRVSVAGGNDETFEARGRMNFAGLGGRHAASVAHGQSAGSRYDTDHRDETFFYSGAWGDTRTGLSLRAGYDEKEFGAYDFYTPGRGYPSKEWTNTSYWDVEGRAGGDEWSIEPRVNWRRHHDKFALNVNNLALYLNHHMTDTTRTGATLTRRFGSWNLPLGFDYGEERITSANLGKHVRGLWDAFLDPAFELNEHTDLAVTLRVDSYTTFGEEFTGGATLTHRYGPDRDVYLTVGRTMRVPTFTELYYSDPTTTGNANLKPEHAVNVEAGWHSRPASDVAATFAVFFRREADTIDFTKLTPADAKFMARNISRANTWGCNAFTRWQASDALALDLRYVYANKALDDGGLLYKYGQSYLNHMVQLGFDWSFPGGAHNRCDIIMKKKPVRRAWVVVNDRFAFPLSAGWQAFCEVYNLFNQEYQEIEGIPVQGRLFKAGLEFTW
ncbi:MAG: TonB-dependent receptor plug domain-containing protein [Deltaproteobacteria bacterium]